MFFRMLLHHNECDMLRRIFYVYYLILYIYRFYIYILFARRLAQLGRGGLKKKKKEVGLPVAAEFILLKYYYTNKYKYRF